MAKIWNVFVFLLLVLAGGRAAEGPISGSCVGTRCDVIHQQFGDFASAHKRCIEQNGHLASVRSAASLDRLSALLRNVSGSFWVGLQSPSGCPDVTSALRSYEWPTNESESVSDTLDRSCISPGCVTVTAEGGFQWEQEASCDEPVSGFVCTHNFSYACTRLADGDVRYDTPLGFGGEELLSLPPGSTATRMPSERKFVCFSKKWLPAPWSCEIFQGGCEHACVHVGPDRKPSCFCPPGLSVDPLNKVTCTKNPDDPCARLGCEHACVEDPRGAHSCTCTHGFRLAPDGRTCVDFNECSDARQCPGENFRCVDSPGGFKCACADGFKLTGGTCADQDECASAPCEHVCHNTAGSYLCLCYEGYVLRGNSCKLHCGKEECPAECDPNNRYQCACADGYIAEEREQHTACIDIDECVFSYCDQLCRNTFGSFTCSCRPGFTLTKEVFCARSEDEDEDWEGSGQATAGPDRHVTPPAPTQRPSTLSPGGLAAILLCCTLAVVLLVLLVHLVCCKRSRVERDLVMEAAGADSRKMEADA
ncbi:thrombomodulin-like [Nerophis lumbriciformis]|uniref:thrombomodulin-like n=1 Tax=Nerophis lumbriciformis TaxID=546530 RepID=UPI002AE081D2|nr:thrombomodulin-like [Nerophis lumbriciformis]